MTGGLVEQFAEVLGAVGGRAHGPLAADEALDLLVTLCRERAGDAAVAVSTGDPVMQTLGVVGKLSAAGLDVLTPDDVFWRERLAEAGVGVTGAVAAVAASGSVGVTCGPGAPRATSLVPPAHICLVFRGTMVGDLGEALLRWAPTTADDADVHSGGRPRTDVHSGGRPRTDVHSGGRPRTPGVPSNLVWVSGPSRSADLELVLTVGVHGPGSVDVIVVEDDGG